MSEENPKIWWQRPLWWSLGAGLLLVLILADVVAAFTLPPRIASHISAASTADQLKAEADLRSAILSLLGALTPLVALIAGIAALLNFQETQRQNRKVQEQNREQLKLQERGQITDRFTKAIAQLGDDTLDIRLGAVYALEQIAKDSQELHWPVMQVLTAYLREHSAKLLPANEEEDKDEMRRRLGLGPPPGQAASQLTQTREDSVEISEAARVKTTDEDEDEDEDEDTDEDEETAQPKTQIALLSPAPVDFLAIAEVVRRRRWERDPVAKTGQDDQLSPEPLNLDGSDLRRANLRGGHFPRALFGRAQLRGANFEGAHLQGADFGGAQLQGANFGGAQLQGANFGGAQLGRATDIDADRTYRSVGTNFTGAQLQRADFGRAQLHDAVFWRAHLHRANFSDAQLQGANFVDARLQGADFRRAELQGTSFRGANLSGVDFHDVDPSQTQGLTQEQLDSASCDNTTEPPLGLTVRASSSVGDEPEAQAWLFLEPELSMTDKYEMSTSLANELTRGQLEWTPGPGGSILVDSDIVPICVAIPTAGDVPNKLAEALSCWLSGGANRSIVIRIGMYSYELGGEGTPEQRQEVQKWLEDCARSPWEWQWSLE